MFNYHGIMFTSGYLFKICKITYFTKFDSVLREKVIDITGTKIVIGVIFILVKRIYGRIYINYMKFDKLKLLFAHFMLKKLRLKF